MISEIEVWRQALQDAFRQAEERNEDSDGMTSPEICEVLGINEHKFRRLVVPLVKTGYIIAYKGPKRNLFGDLKMTYMYRIADAKKRKNRNGRPTTKSR